MSPVLIIQLFLTGALAGLAAGFLGIGGGAILTPLCLMIYPAVGIHDINLVKIIFGSNMFLIFIFSVSAVLKHHRNNKVEWRTVWIMGPLAILGALAGAWAASVTDPGALKKAFALLLIIPSLLIILKGSTRPDRKGETRKALISLKLLPVLGLITGFVGSFLGIGGGVIMIIPLILVFALPIDRVAGTSSSVIIFIGLTGGLSYMWHGRGMVDLPGWSTGYVWWSAALPLAFGGVPMAQVGAWLNSRIRAKLLRRIFGIVLLLIAVRMFFFT